MTVSDLITKLQTYPPDKRVVFCEPSTELFLGIEISEVRVDNVDFIQISSNQELEKW